LRRGYAVDEPIGKSIDGSIAQRASKVNGRMNHVAQGYHFTSGPRRHARA
jgi:hypothetical protein